MQNWQMLSVIITKYSLFYLELFKEGLFRFQGLKYQELTIHVYDCLTKVLSYLNGHKMAR